MVLVTKKSGSESTTIEGELEEKTIGSSELGAAENGAPPLQKAAEPECSPTLEKGVLENVLTRDSNAKSKASFSLRQTNQRDPAPPAPDISSPVAVHGAARFLGDAAKQLVDGNFSPRYSDHNPCLFTVPLGERRALPTLSWNVAWQYRERTSGSGANNGFGIRDEDDGSYGERLQRIANKVLEFARIEDPPVILLQECPWPGEPGHGVLRTALDEGLGPAYTILRQGEFLTAVKGPAHSLSIDSDSGRQRNRLHAVYLEDLDTIVINVHLRWDERGSKEARQTKKAVDSALASLRREYPQSPIVVTGDFNRVPESAGADPTETVEKLAAGSNGSLLYPPAETNVKWVPSRKKEEGHSRMTWTDFAWILHPSR